MVFFSLEGIHYVGPKLNEKSTAVLRVFRAEDVAPVYKTLVSTRLMVTRKCHL